MCWRLHPYVLEAATPCARGCNPMCQALELFADNPFKLSMINSKLPDGSSTTVYQNGPFVDLCRGRAVVCVW